MDEHDAFAVSMLVAKAFSQVAPPRGSAGHRSADLQEIIRLVLEDASHITNPKRLEVDPSDVVAVISEDRYTLSQVDGRWIVVADESGM